MIEIAGKIRKFGYDPDKLYNSLQACRRCGSKQTVVDILDAHTVTVRCTSGMCPGHLCRERLMITAQPQADTHPAEGDARSEFRTTRAFADSRGNTV